MSSNDEEKPKIDLKELKKKFKKQNVYDFEQIKKEFLNKITDVNDKNNLKIQILLDYKDFLKNKTDEIGVSYLTTKYKDELNPINMFNFSLNQSGSAAPTLLLPNNITYNELTEILQELNAKTLSGGSKKTKRSLPKHKKHKTEKKKN